jgi:hypothetical protein
MAQKQITDLALATSFDVGDLLLLRKTGEGVDKAITQQTFIETLGNPSVTGFTATSTVANQVVLTPSNDVVIDKYYNGMIVSFISPITSTGAVTIKIGTLTFRTLQELGGATTSILLTGKFYQCVFIGTAGAGTFFQTNVVIPYIFTNEYIAAGTVQPGDTSTKYALTTAIGASKTTTGYYNGMSALFTADIASKGAVILNIDGLGEKSLQDPVGDDIPFNLLANEAIFAIYDGTVFRKRMFTDVEPIDPDPIDPPADITVNVGPTRTIKTILSALAQLTRDYNEDGDGNTAVVQLDADYIQASREIIKYDSPWITIKAHASGNVVRGFNADGKCNINFEGIFNHTPIVGSNSFLIISTGRFTFKNSTINCLGASTLTTECVEIRSTAGSGINDATVFQNVNVNNFAILLTDNFTSSTSTGNFRYDTGVVVMRNTGSGIDQPIVNSFGTVTLNNINFGETNRNPAATSIIFINRALFMDNSTMTTSSDISIVYCTANSNDQSILTNCILKNTTGSSTPAILSGAPLIISGGDFRHPTSSSFPDIFAQDYAGAIIRLRSNPLGSTGKVGKGQIINE